MNVLSLFSGIGLLDLGLAWAGFRTVGLCEIEPYCRWVLGQHWPGVPIWSDVREVTGDAVRERCGAVDLVAGGFPCQPHSVAGSRKGREDERHLWPEFARVVREVRPRWVLAENVPGLRTTAADEVLADLDAAGYACWPLVVGADDVGAPHRRKRVWIVGQSAGAGLEAGRGMPEPARTEQPEHPCPGDPTLLRGWPARPGEQQREWEAPRLAHSESHGRRDREDSRGRGSQGSGEGSAGDQSSAGLARCGAACKREGQPESRLGVSVDGSARWLARCRSAARRARLKALGNGVVPAVVHAVGVAILQTEEALNG